MNNVTSNSYIQPLTDLGKKLLNFSFPQNSKDIFGN